MRKVYCDVCKKEMDRIIPNEFGVYVVMTHRGGEFSIDTNKSESGWAMDVCGVCLENLKQTIADFVESSRPEG
jgi:hypothetical protein